MRSPRLRNTEGVGARSARSGAGLEAGSRLEDDPLRPVRLTTDEHDGWCLADADDRPQWLLGIHRTSTLRRALERLGSPRDRSLRELFAEATLVTLPASRDDVADIDTWADLRDPRRLQALLTPALKAS